MVDDILRAQNVLYGLVLGTYPDKNYDTAYTVELEVYCILKGPTTQSIIVNMTGGGWTPGHCESSEYLVGHTYVVRGHDLTIEGGDINATEENLQEITKACGLNPVTRPTGSSSQFNCPVSAKECQSEPTPYDRPTLSPKDILYLESLKDKQMDDDKPTTSTAHVTVAMTTLAAASAALVLSKIIN